MCEQLGGGRVGFIEFGWRGGGARRWSRRREEGDADQRGLTWRGRGFWVSQQLLDHDTQATVCLGVREPRARAVGGRR